MGDCMNNYIKYYYNIYPDSIYEENKMFRFEYNNEKYYFVIFDRPIDDADYLYELNKEMIRQNSLVHEMVINKNNHILTIVNDIPYVLMKVYINENKKSDLTEIIFISMNNANIKQNKILDRSDWITLWSSKIDYFEYQISQMGKEYPIICEYLSYYIGLAENALSYAQNTMSEIRMTEYDTLTVAHRRIKSTDTLFDIYNPISFVIDHQVRDLSEYIKSNFFDGVDVWLEIGECFSHYGLSPYSKRLLFARLLFPTYFFDVYEMIVEGKLKEEDILPFISKAKQYEEFLIEFHDYIDSEKLMPKVEWLNKKNSH